MSNLKHGALCGSTEDVLGIIGTTQRNGSRSTVVPARRGHPHTSNISLVWLRERYHDRLISRRCDVEWAADSPDLNPPDFYLWGYLKDNVYENNLQTIGELKAAITRKIRQIPKEECVRVIDNFARRGQVCLQRRGQHLEHILKRT